MWTKHSATIRILYLALHFVLFKFYIWFSVSEFGEPRTFMKYSQFTQHNICQNSLLLLLYCWGSVSCSRILIDNAKTLLKSLSCYTNSSFEDLHLFQCLAVMELRRKRKNKINCYHQVFESSCVMYHSYSLWANVKKNEKLYLIVIKSFRV